MKDIIGLHDTAVDLLTNYDFDQLQMAFLEGFFSAMYDEIHELTIPNTEITEEDLINFIEDIWQRKNAIVEDDQLRRRFCLLCQKIIQVFEWNQ